MKGNVDKRAKPKLILNADFMKIRQRGCFFANKPECCLFWFLSHTYVSTTCGLIREIITAIWDDHQCVHRLVIQLVGLRFSKLAIIENTSKISIIIVSHLPSVNRAHTLALAMSLNRDQSDGFRVISMIYFVTANNWFLLSFQWAGQAGV